MSGAPRIKTLPETLKDLERRVRTMERSSRLNSASISQGNLTIRDGGSLILDDGGVARSSDYTESGNTGWQIDGDGNAVFNSISIREGQIPVSETTSTDMALSGHADLYFPGPEWATHAEVLVVASFSVTNAAGVPPMTGDFTFDLGIGGGSTVTSPKGYSNAHPGNTSIILATSLDFTAGTAGFNGSVTTPFGTVGPRLQMSTMITWS